jgi:thymidylate synthase (FAD)
MSKLSLPNKLYFGEKPRTEFDVDLQNIEVELVSSMPENVEELFYKLVKSSWEIADASDEEEVKRVIKAMLDGGSLQIALESIVFTFLVKGVSRLATHQIVRSRVGVGYAQETSENDWRHHRVRTFSAFGKFEKKYRQLVEECKKLYAEMVDSGVGVDLARAILPQAVETYIYVIINFRALQNFVATRLCENQWCETAYVALLMKKRVEEKYPLLGKYLKPLCEIAGRCVYGGKDTYSGCLYRPCGKEKTGPGHEHPYVYDKSPQEMRGFRVVEAKRSE